jgi:sigma-B regulation protein RsbU (phosphoserine phosphatase)
MGNQTMNESIEPIDRQLTERYAAALRDYLVGTGEGVLSHAYELGRETAIRSMSVLALTTIHHESLAKLAPQQGLGEAGRAETVLRKAATWFGTVLRGYESVPAARRGLDESLSRTEREKDRVIRELRQTEETLRSAQAELEKRVLAQDAQLTAAGETLRAEIAERKLTEVALRESEARFRIMFEKAGIGIGLLDKTGRVRESNLALQQMLGCSGDELHGGTLFALTHPEDVEVSVRMFRELVEGKHRHYKLEKRFIKKDGSLLWVRKIVSGVYGFRDELQFAIDMMEDITENKRAEEALRESEARFRQVADMTGEWIWEQDPEGRYIYSSAAVKDILGYRADEILARYYYELFTPEDRARIAPLSPEMIARKEPFVHIINRYRNKDGHEVFTESTGTPILDDEGNLLKWRGVDHDVTERKRFEDALRLRDRAIEASSVGIIITDPHQPGNPIIYTNRAFTQMTGYSREELMGRNPRFLQGPGTDPKSIEEIRQALREGRDCHLTLKNYRKDGVPFWNELLISPVRNERGRLTHFIGIQTDVTALRRVEEERHELEIARQIQLSLLPGAPLRADGVLIAGYCLPAAHVGGDYFDYFNTEDTVDVVIADVAGHSVGAAMIMAETRSTLKMEAHWRLREKAGLANGAAATLTVLNDLLFEDLNRAESFISMFYVKCHAASRMLSYANAGHNRPLLLRRGESACMELDADGLILGVQKDVAFEEKKVPFENGDVLLLYTDGITEAQDKRGEFFGAERLCDVFAAHAQSPPRVIIDAVIKALEAFCQSRSFNDDISLVVVKAK